MARVVNTFLVRPAVPYEATGTEGSAKITAYGSFAWSYSTTTFATRNCRVGAWWHRAVMKLYCRLASSRTCVPHPEEVSEAGVRTLRRETSVGDNAQ